MKKLITAILLSALILSSVACGGTPSGQSETSAPDDGQTGTTAEETTSSLEVKDFGNYTLRVLTRDDGATAWRTLDLVAESESGDAINDAVYKRNQAVFETYNVNIERVIVDFSQTVNLVQQSVLAGSDDYDLVLNILVNQAKLSAAECLYDLTSLPYIDVDNKCWDTVGNDCMRIGGKLYCVMGDINITDNDATYCTLFNKKLKEQNTSVPDLYQLVKDGKWTLDKLKEFAVSSTQDVNGNGELEWDKDMWGVIDQYEIGVALLLGSGMKAVNTDKDGYLVYNLSDQKINTAFGKIYDFFADQTYQLTADNSKWSSVKDLWNVLARGTFKEDRALFFMGHIGNVRLIRDMETDFGILPIPKLDESQEIYHSMMQSNNATAYSIPITADAERSALILEALGEGSTDTLLPAYYETTLKRKASRDSESSDMLDLIFANRVVDYCNTYTDIGINSFIQSELKATSNTFASGEASNRATYIENIDKINESYKK